MIAFYLFTTGWKSNAHDQTEQIIFFFFFRFQRITRKKKENRKFHIPMQRSEPHLTVGDAQLKVKTSLCGTLDSYGVEFIALVFNVMQRMRAASVRVATRKRDLGGKRSDDSVVRCMQIFGDRFELVMEMLMKSKHLHMLHTCTTSRPAKSFPRTFFFRFFLGKFTL